MKKVTVDPITRLEGHGKIEIFVDDDNKVQNVYFQIPELRGFERFCVGRPVEELARITPRICGVCPEAHHMAATKAIDDVFGVEVAPTGRKLRELLYNTFYVTDHTTHFYVLAGPDFIMGPESDPAARNILGVIGKVGLETAGAMIKLRAEAAEVISMIGGKQIHPVCGLPGGVSTGHHRRAARPHRRGHGGAGRVRQVHAAALRRRRARQHRLRRPHQERRVHP